MIFAIFFIGILMGSIGGILLKIGATQVGQIEMSSVGQMLVYVFRLLTNAPAFLGLVLYFASGLIWSYLLTKRDISFVQPILALTYVLTPILAIFILDEHISLVRWIGIIVIIAGVVIVARSAT